MKEEIKIYKDGAEIRFLDTRILMQKLPDNQGYQFEFHRIIKGRTWKTTRVKRVHGCKVITRINLSDKAVKGIVQGFMELLKRNK